MSDSQQATVFIVDDDTHVRNATALLMQSVGLPMVAYSTAQEFLEKYDGRPGCLVLDVRMPGMSGLELQQRLNELGRPLSIIMVTGHADVPMTVRAVKAGAVDFLQKPFNDQQLLERVHQAIEQNLKYRKRQEERDKVAARLSGLTPRERQVLDLIVRGETNKAIATQLGISRKTLDIHRAKVMSKMEAESIAQLVHMALLDQDPAATPPDLSAH
jgi:FixJ family two-component response regulator